MLAAFVWPGAAQHRAGGLHACALSIWGTREECEWGLLSGLVGVELQAGPGAGWPWWAPAFRPLLLSQLLLLLLSARVSSMQLVMSWTFHSLASDPASASWSRNTFPAFLGVQNSFPFVLHLGKSDAFCYLFVHFCTGGGGGAVVPEQSFPWPLMVEGTSGVRLLHVSITQVCS